MRDRRPEWACGRLLGVGVDPLRVVRRVRELVDPRLLDLAPRRDELLADQVLDYQRTTAAAQV